MATILLNGVLASEALNATVVGTAIGDTLAANGQLIAGKLGGLNGNDTIAYQLFGTTTNTAAIDNSLINGNQGNDLISFVNTTPANIAFTRSSSIFGGSGNDSISFDATTRLGNATNVQGNAGNDVITFFTSNFATVNGNEDNDTISILGGGTINRTGLFGGSGDDSISTGAGTIVTASTIQGNDGNDSITISGSTFQNILINGNAGNDSITADANTRFLLNSVTVRAGIGNDNINFATLAAGNNALIFGDAGNNTLTGGLGNDTINGGTGNDTITGGAGIDIMTGGLGAAQFVQSVSGQGAAMTASVVAADNFSTGDTFTLGGGVDIVTDFKVTDTIDVAGAGGNATNRFNAAASSQMSASTGFLRGAFNAATSVFTVGSAANNGVDVLVAVAAGTGAASNIFSSNTSLILLRGFNNDLANTNLV